MRSLFSRSVVPLVAIVLVLTSCGLKPKVFVRPVVKQTNRTLPGQKEGVNPMVAADAALQRQREIVVLTMIAARASAPTVEARPVAAVPARSTATGAASSWSWDCVATAETGGDWTAHGPSYSSALGVMNEAVRENAPADVAVRILNGTASRDEQIAMAQSILSRHGEGAWAWQTRQRCG